MVPILQCCWDLHKRGLLFPQQAEYHFNIIPSPEHQAGIAMIQLPNPQKNTLWLRQVVVVVISTS